MDTHSEQKRRLHFCKAQLSLFHTYLGTMEGSLEAETKKILRERKKTEEELERIELESPVVSPDDIDIWEIRSGAYEIPPRKASSVP